MQSELAFLNSMVQGVIASAILCFFILLVLTRNILIALYAMKTVAFIVVCVLAVMVLNDYHLGVSDSVGIVMIIGISVDYVVLLAVHYVHVSVTPRFDKATDSIQLMGISIFSGAMTTLGSGVFLFGGAFIFF